MPNLPKGKDCCGCSACFAICPKTAITMSPDALGFRYPDVDPDKCIECKLCEKVCAFNDGYKTPANFSEPIPLGVRLKDMKEMMESRSGGAFKAITDYVLRKEGVIYGVVVDENMKICHRRATTSNERDAFKGSKYVQSDTMDSFRCVLADLKAGKTVLFSGTACQTAGLSSYIPQPLHTNLILVDIVCHGVPSPSIWHDFTKYVGKRYNSKVVKVDFRNKKKFGWQAHFETLTLENGETVSSKTYTYLFYQHICLRPSCSICHFTNLRRPSDLTLADFWGSEKTDPNFNNDNKGASLLLLNTPKGKEIWEEIKNECHFITPRLSNCLQPNFQHPTPINKDSDAFAQDYTRKGFMYVLKKYGNVGFRYKTKFYSDKIKNRLRRLWASNKN